MNRYPKGTATHAVKIVAVKETGAAATTAAEEGLEDEQGAIAWCALHGRAAATAEDELATELAAKDAKVHKEPHTIVDILQLYLHCAVRHFSSRPI